MYQLRILWGLHKATPSKKSERLHNSNEGLCAALEWLGGTIGLLCLSMKIKYPN